MKIAIIPSIKEPYKNQLEYSIDVKLFKLINVCFPKCEIISLTKSDKLNKKFKLLIISGGNTILNFSKSKKNKFRNLIDERFYKQAIKNKIPIFGICHGAQFLAKKIGGEFIKKKDVGPHKINLVKSNKIIRVNSYHNIVIKKISQNTKILATSLDGSIEYFKKNKIIGIQWHPERYKNFKIFDKNIIRKICN